MLKTSLHLRKTVIMRKPRVLIVGAGAAGIAATARLLENGFNDIIVLEAGTRIGGRIHSVDFAGGVAELGAQWCHGEKGNIVNDLVKNLNLLSPSSNSYDDFTFYESSGKLLPRNVTDKLLKIACEISYDDGALSSFNGSFGGYFSERFRRRVTEEFKGDKKSQNIAAEFEEWYQKLIICLDAAPSWFDLSARGLLHYKECDGDKYLNWGNRGYKTILDVLMRKYPNPANQLPIDDKIFFKKEVAKIIWDNNYVNNGGVTVECVDGSSYSADHAILTFSLGILKRKFTYIFNPQLPQEKQNAITGLGFGTVNKILLEFPDQWWPSDCKGFNFMWTNKDRADVLRKFPALSCLTGRSWLEDVFGFHTIDSHPNVLLGWIVGSQVEEIEALSDRVITDGCMYLLRKFVGFKYTILPPCNMICSSWKSHSHFLGSYSYRSNLSEEMRVSASDLSEPVVANSKQVLLFSGEATHPTYYSTVHGAIESGFREADRLINIYNHYPQHLESKL